MLVLLVCTLARTMHELKLKLVGARGKLAECRRELLGRSALKRVTSESNRSEAEESLIQKSIALRVQFKYTW